MEDRIDAVVRFARTFAQGLVVTAGTGAAAGLDDLVGSGETVTLETMAVAALVGAGLSAVSWIQRRLEGWRDRRRAAAESA